MIMFAQRFVELFKVIDRTAITGGINITIARNSISSAVISMPIASPVMRSCIKPGKYSSKVGVTTITQKNTRPENLNLGSKSENTRAGSLARTGHEQPNQGWCKPPKRFEYNKTNIDFNGFREYLNAKYVKQYARSCYYYALKYCDLIENPSMLETFSKYKKNNVLKALIALAKYHGFYIEFKQIVKEYGIKWSQTSSFDSFLRILSNNNSTILSWFKRASEVMDRESKLYLKFLLLSGTRPTEAIESFNLIRTKLREYYNEELGTLEHYRYKDLFLRDTKNLFISIVPKPLILEIAKKDKVTYPMVVKKLQRNNLPTRLNELRDYYATFMVRHGLIKEEVDLLQGRISKSIFVRHYWTPSFKELRDRTLEAVKKLESTLP